MVTYNSIKFFDPTFIEAGKWLFWENQLNSLKNIIMHTWAKIVISSSWRRNMMDKVRDEFYLAEEKTWFNFWSHVISQTPDSLWYWRWNEILSWIDRHHATCWVWDHITHWVAIDDNDHDMKCIKRLWRFVHTRVWDWLTKEKFCEVMLILWQK